MPLLLSLNWQLLGRRCHEHCLSIDTLDLLRYWPSWGKDCASLHGCLWLLKQNRRITFTDLLLSGVVGRSLAQTRSIGRKRKVIILLLDAINRLPTLSSVKRCIYQNVFWEDILFINRGIAYWSLTQLSLEYHEHRMKCFFTWSWFFLYPWKAFIQKSEDKYIHNCHIFSSKWHFSQKFPPRNQKEIKPRKLAVVVLDDPIIMRLWTKRCSDSYVYSSWNNKPLSKRTCQWLALKVHVVFKYNSGSSPNLMLLYLLKALPYSCQNNWLSFKTIFCRCI